MKTERLWPNPCHLKSQTRAGPAVMDFQVVPGYLFALSCGVLGGWHFRKELEPSEPVCNCACTCQCISELGISAGTWLGFIVLSTIVCGLAIGVHQYFQHVSHEEVVGGKAPVRRQKGVFGSVGQLSLVG